MMSPGVGRPRDRTSNHGSCRSDGQEQGKVLYTGVFERRDGNEDSVSNDTDDRPAHEEETPATVFVGKPGGSQGRDEAEDVGWT